MSLNLDESMDQMVIQPIICKAALKFVLCTYISRDSQFLTHFGTDHSSSHGIEFPMCQIQSLYVNPASVKNVDLYKTSIYDI